jgi:ABC-type lipoprotein release transport system permease subunit
MLHELRYSVRSFMRAPGIALALLFTIALGIGSNVCIRGFIEGLTKPPAALTSSDRVVSVFGRVGHGEAGPLSYQEYLSLKSRRDVFEWIGAARVSPCDVESGGQAETVAAAAVTSNLAALLKLPLDGGVVISHRMWQNEFGAKTDVRGEPIRIAGSDARVSGVAPEWLEGVYRDRAVDLWMPLPEETLRRTDRTSRNFWILGRLRRNVSSSQAQTAVGPSAGSSTEVRVLPYTGMTPEMASGLARVGTVLSFAAGAVFFIACANVACFLLGRAFTRSREISLRVALGASRGQLAGESLSDSIVICIGGGALGMLLAVWTSHVIPALLFEQDAARLVSAPDLASIVLASTACVGITIVCGLLPAMAIPYETPWAVLRRESVGPSKAIRHLRAGLVVGQMASFCLLAVSAAFLTEGLRTALQTSAGHRLSHAILATVQAHLDVGVDIGYFERVERAVQSMAGISAMAWAGRLPGSQPEWQSLRIEPRQLPLREVKMGVASFTGGSLDLFILPPKAGRMFGFVERACRAAIVNDAAAEELFGKYTAGRTVQDMTGMPVEIIGVVAERKAEQAAKGSRPTIYFNHTDQTAPPDRITLARFRAPIVTELASAELDANVVSASYFQMMGLSLNAGQGFDQLTRGGCRIGVVNQEAANLYFGGQAVGAAVIDDKGFRTGIVGVVQSRPLGTFQRRADPTIYLPMPQDALFRMTLIASATEVNDPLLAELRRRIDSVPGSGGARAVVKTFDTHLTQTALAPLRLAATIMSASATTGLVLSVLGLLGALSDAARQRRRELAVRVALGAQRWRVVGQVLVEGGRLACAGAVAGMFGSLVLSRLLARITPVGSSPALWVWLAAPLVLAGAVAIASVLPARRALIVNPLMIMRDDN